MARAGLGLGAQGLADQAGVSYPTLNRFEKGETISADNVAKIEAALDGAGAGFTRRGGRVGVTVPA